MTALTFDKGGGRHVLAPAMPGSAVRVVSLALTAKVHSAVSFYSHNPDDDAWVLIAGTFYLEIGAPLVLPWVGNGWFETMHGDELVIELDAQAVVGGVATFGGAP